MQCESFTNVIISAILFQMKGVVRCLSLRSAIGIRVIIVRTTLYSLVCQDKISDAKLAYQYRVSDRVQYCAVDLVPISHPLLYRRVCPGLQVTCPALQNISIIALIVDRASLQSIAPNRFLLGKWVRYLHLFSAPKNSLPNDSHFTLVVDRTVNLLWTLVNKWGYFTSKSNTELWTVTNWGLIHFLCYSLTTWGHKSKKYLE